MRFAIGFGMIVAARTLGGFFLAGAGVMTVCSSLAGIDPLPAVRRWHGNNLSPVAELAWAQARCDSRLTLSPGTPRLQTEDLLQTAGEFDALEQQRGRLATCRKATALAAMVSAEPNPSEVSHQGGVASLRGCRSTRCRPEIPLLKRKAPNFPIGLPAASHGAQS